MVRPIQRDRPPAIKYADRYMVGGHAWAGQREARDPHVSMMRALTAASGRTRMLGRQSEMAIGSAR
jgi:hypothetical protein